MPPRKRKAGGGEEPPRRSTRLQGEHGKDAEKNQPQGTAEMATDTVPEETYGELEKLSVIELPENLRQDLFPSSSINSTVCSFCGTGDGDLLRCAALVVPVDGGGAQKCCRAAHRGCVGLEGVAPLNWTRYGIPGIIKKDDGAVEFNCPFCVAMNTLPEAPKVRMNNLNDKRADEGRRKSLIKIAANLARNGVYPPAVELKFYDRSGIRPQKKNNTGVGENRGIPVDFPGPVEATGIVANWRGNIDVRSRHRTFETACISLRQALDKNALFTEHKFGNAQKQELSIGRARKSCARVSKMLYPAGDQELEIVDSEGNSFAAGQTPAIKDIFLQLQGSKKKPMLRMDHITSRNPRQILHEVDPDARAAAADQRALAIDAAARQRTREAIEVMDTDSEITYAFCSETGDEYGEDVHINVRSTYIILRCPGCDDERRELYTFLADPGGCHPRRELIAQGTTFGDVCLRIFFVAASQLNCEDAVLLFPENFGGELDAFLSILKANPSLLRTRIMDLPGDHDVILSTCPTLRGTFFYAGRGYVDFITDRNVNLEERFGLKSAAGGLNSMIREGTVDYIIGQSDENEAEASSPSSDCGRGIFNVPVDVNWLAPILAECTDATGQNVRVEVIDNLTLKVQIYMKHWEEYGFKLSYEFLVTCWTRNGVENFDATKDHLKKHQLGTRDVVPVIHATRPGAVPFIYRDGLRPGPCQGNQDYPVSFGATGWQFTKPIANVNVETVVGATASRAPTAVDPIPSTGAGGPNASPPSNTDALSSTCFENILESINNDDVFQGFIPLDVLLRYVEEGLITIEPGSAIWDALKITLNTAICRRRFDMNEQNPVKRIKFLKDYVKLGKGWENIEYFKQLNKISALVYTPDREELLKSALGAISHKIALPAHVTESLGQIIKQEGNDQACVIFESFASNKVGRSRSYSTGFRSSYENSIDGDNSQVDANNDLLGKPVMVLEFQLFKGNKKARMEQARESARVVCATIEKFLKTLDDETRSTLQLPARYEKINSPVYNALLAVINTDAGE